MNATDLIGWQAFSEVRKFGNGSTLPSHVRSKKQKLSTIIYKRNDLSPLLFLSWSINAFANISASLNYFCDI